MNILITGAAGGIGSMLAYHLSNKHNLYLIDNLRSGSIENLRFGGVDFEQNFIVGDIREIENCIENSIANSVKFDAVIHLAAITSLAECESDSKECISVNVDGTLSVLNYCRKKEIPYVLFASTSAVYENNQTLPFSENDNVHPTLMYSLSKKIGEEICNSYRENYGMHITVARFFNVFGPRQNCYRKNPPLLNYLVKEITNNRQPVLHSNGNQERDYIHVSDVVSFIEKCLDIKPNCTLNVCSETTMSVREIVKIVKNVLHSKIEPIYRDGKMLWDSHPSLFYGKYHLSKDRVLKEVNKTSIGSAKLAYKEIGWKASKEIENLIQDTVLEIQRLLEKHT